MELNNIPEAFQTKLRVAILSALVTGKKSFKEMKQLTGATDGNISVQVGKLEELGYVVTSKTFIGKKPCTIYALTAAGRESFAAYVEMMAGILRQAAQDEEE